ncbi:hypothetical protein VB712_00680 [Spirulina sp. CCNP1310]|uniref:antitoxin TumA n=1 Tax=Spirulina sp. CCNP1310 TaxID=3110249 RepID=UPI002B2184A6|nr:hypothetical protein [Spirulina sp. CCNP1310]MEA5417716.1 hypothetical protein [Spirulina sp. CCNP1310]
MKKNIIQYTSLLDAFVAIVKQLTIYEAQYNLDSAEFFTQYSQGKTNDDQIFVEWAGNYRHYLALHQELTQKLSPLP